MVFNIKEENTRIVLKNMVGAFVVKGFALLLSLFTTPAYIRYFNNNTILGLWFTLLSVLSWVLNFDLGIGNGLRNKLTSALVQKEERKAREYISTAYLSVGCISIFAIIAFLIIAQFVNWEIVFNVNTVDDHVSSSSLKLAVIIVFVGIMLQFFFKLIGSIIYAIQKSSINNFLSLISSILIFVFVSFVPGSATDKDLITLAIVHSLAVIVPLIVASIIIFSTKLKNLKPVFGFFEKKAVKDIMSLGGIFFLLQILYMVIISSNDYLINLFMHSEKVVDYQIYYRFFSMGSTIFTLALTPIWSIVTKAINEKKGTWVRSLYHKILVLAMIASIFEFLIALFFQMIVNIFYGDAAIVVNKWYSVSFALFGTLLIFNAAFSSITNGLSKLKGQLFAFSIGAIIKIPLTYFLITVFESWIGAVLSTSIALLIYCIIEPIYIRICLSFQKPNHL